VRVERDGDPALGEVEGDRHAVERVVLAELLADRPQVLADLPASSLVAGSTRTGAAGGTRGTGASGAVVRDWTHIAVPEVEGERDEPGGDDEREAQARPDPAAEDG